MYKKNSTVVNKSFKLSGFWREVLNDNNGNMFFDPSTVNNTTSTTGFVAYKDLHHC